MDVKGIAWVGNVYEKFENMCLEVEEVMYQDTVRYVEDQVQSVGASVRRLMHDFLPSDQDSDDGDPKKSDREKSTVDLSVPPLARVCRDAEDSCRPSGDCARVGSGLRSRKFRGGASELDVPKIRVSCSTKSVSGGSANEICDGLSDRTAEKTIVCCTDETRERNENESEFVAEGLDEIVLIESIGNDEYENKGILSSCEKMLNCELATEVKTGFEETVQPQNKSSLEETVVMVNEDDLQFLPHKEFSKRPSKKKTRQSFYSRMRSARKNEYKQLALQYVDNPNQENDKPSTPKLTAEKFPSRDSSESEWELL